MRCVTARRRLSDALDGALSGRRKSRLEAHLRACPACRDCRAGLERLQAAAKLPEAPAGHWEAFERRLEAGLDAAGTGRIPVRAPFAARRRWAWAAASAAILAGAALWYALLRPGAMTMENYYAYEDLLGPLVEEAGSSPELAAWVDREMTASIAEAVPDWAGESTLVPADDPLFWEGLTDDELKAIAGAIEAQEDTGRGGPR
jgi:hypothetical protein